MEQDDRLAVFVSDGGSGIGGITDTVGTYMTFDASAPPPPGTTLSGGTLGGGPVRLSISAVVEPDADHDGYGDETQDTCASDPGTHDQPCVSDLSVGAAASPGTIAQGDVTTIVAPITANGGPAPGSVATLLVPAGLSVIAASTTGGDCAGATCPLGDLAPGATRKAYIVVRGTAVGTHALGVSVASTRPDGNPSNNAAAATVTVTTPIVSGPPPATPVKLCRVPSLKGKTAAAAKKALTNAGCKAGKATGSKSKKAKVKSQTIPAGVRVVAGTKVGYSLKAPAVKKQAKKRR